MYGDAVQVDYHDVARAEDRQACHALLRGLGYRQVYYPLVFVDGELTVEGGAKFYHVLRAVREVAALPPR